MPEFEFANEWKPTNSIEIENIGNFYLEGVNEEDGFYYYLSFITTLGTSTIMYYGPIIPDVTLLPDTYNVSFARIPFNDKKTSMWIYKWLNDRAKNITAAYIIDKKTFEENYKDVLKYIDGYNNGVY